MRLLDAGGTRADAHVHVVGNALLSDQEEYLEAGVDQCVQAIYSCFCLSRFEAECTDWGFFRGASSVLTKPVLEKSLRHMLNVASERLQAKPGLSASAPS